ncbi:MAG TPA: helical backbone metal receptor [Myxococcota bacterium]|jgi:iron complex transport system substrate-binding protein
MPLRPLAAALLLALAALPAAAGPPARRVVSLNPSLTATLLALGAGAQLVGVDDYSARQQSAVRDLPAVGGLFNPSLEAILALTPDLVVLVPSAQQRDLRARLEALGVEVLELPNITLAELLASIEALGARVGREAAARARVQEIESAWRKVAAASAARPRVRTVLVLQREPLYVVGRGSFIDSMLATAGAENPANMFAEPYPRASLEWLIAAAPELILDASEDPEEPREFWARWPSLPAVAAGRVLRIPASEVTLPGPFPERALARIAEAIHPAPAGSRP